MLFNWYFRRISRSKLFICSRSIASGMVAAINACTQFYDINKNIIIFPNDTVIGALSKYISTPNNNFQPMNANFGILPELEKNIKDKKQRYTAFAKRSLDSLQEYCKNIKFL